MNFLVTYVKPKRATEPLESAFVTFLREHETWDEARLAGEDFAQRVFPNWELVVIVALTSAHLDELRAVFNGGQE